MAVVRIVLYLHDEVMKFYLYAVKKLYSENSKIDELISGCLLAASTLHTQCQCLHEVRCHYIANFSYPGNKKNRIIFLIVYTNQLSVLLDLIHSSFLPQKRTVSKLCYCNCYYINICLNFFIFYLYKLL